MHRRERERDTHARTHAYGSSKICAAKTKRESVKEKISIEHDAEARETTGDPFLSCAFLNAETLRSTTRATVAVTSDKNVTKRPREMYGERPRERPRKREGER